MLRGRERGGGGVAAFVGAGVGLGWPRESRTGASGQRAGVGWTRQHHYGHGEGVRRRPVPGAFSLLLRRGKSVKVSVPSTSAGKAAVEAQRNAGEELKVVREQPTEDASAVVTRSMWRTRLEGFGRGLAVFLAISYVLEKLTPALRRVAHQAKRQAELAKQRQASSSTAAPRTTAPATTSPTTAGSNTSAVAATAKSWAGNDQLAALEVVNRLTGRKLTIIGGKGGVGKTSIAAATAVRFADEGQTTLIISTDPAHSLSDAFDQDVSSGSPVAVLNIDRLYAMEVDPEQVKTSFRMLPEAQKMQVLGGMDMGLEEFDSLFETLPPGFDEAIALVEIIKLIQGDPSFARFERVVIDTAPTGHTLRLLALPDFLNSFAGKLMSMKSKLGGMMGQFKNLFGGNEGDSLNGPDSADMEEMKRSMQMVRDLFRDTAQTEFIVSTIPTMMSISESQRLVRDLKRERIPCRHIFVNMVQPANEQCKFCSARHREHLANYEYVKRAFADYEVSPVRFFDREVRGLYALRAMAEALYVRDASAAEAAVTAPSGNGQRPGDDSSSSSSAEGSSHSAVP
ncbi:hypothetical protein CDCA_CDCA11G3147 [Cyanidium caldarium]|uniref:ArsA/GET3 Anion-transporting ATPase-like domain-containing protein n=1 Tax=Cyanidium caldarium TaxID=2771 RepID=A0AAV9IXR4_CYACA|nr:hypothetical protein CDCA_CDCA11G3147 [Cyanidium caldarium]